MRSEWMIRALAIGCTALALAGCNADRTVAEASLVDDPAMLQDETEFLDGLSTQYTVTNHDALHALILLADQEDPFETYEDRVATAKDRGWLNAKWDQPANQSAQIGDIAQAVCVITGIEGGVTMRLFGPSPRYATRELIYLEVIPDRSERQSVRGLEFLELMLLAGDYLRKDERPDTVEERLEQLEARRAQQAEEQGPAPAAEAVPPGPDGADDPDGIPQ